MIGDILYLQRMLMVSIGVPLQNTLQTHLYRHFQIFTAVGFESYNPLTLLSNQWPIKSARYKGLCETVTESRRYEIMCTKPPI